MYQAATGRNRAFVYRNTDKNILHPYNATIWVGTNRTAGPGFPTITIAKRWCAHRLGIPLKWINVHEEVSIK